MRPRRLIALAVFVVAACAVWLGGRWMTSAREESRHAERDETELRVGLPAGADSFELHVAGQSLAEARLLPGPPRTSVWLAPGNYMIGAGALWYPAPLTGYRSGPDRDGAFTVSVRPRLPEPPRCAEDDPPFAFVPSGSFLIGDRANPREPHHVWLPAYFIAVFETTNAQFRRFRPGGGISGDARFNQPEYPVVEVSWNDAAEYARWLTSTCGGGRWTFSLPSDAEWEKAARGPDQFDYGLGNRVSDAETPSYNWKKNPGATVTVVGWKETQSRFQPNRYGVYHASGNVAEWTASAFWPYSRRQPYTEGKRNLPDPGQRRSVRGGSWYSATSAPLYLPYRDGLQPEHRNNDLGFRIVARMNP